MRTLPTRPLLPRRCGWFCRIWFRPRVMRDVAKVDYSTSILGVKSSMPLYIVNPFRTVSTLYTLKCFCGDRLRQLSVNWVIQMENSTLHGPLLSMVLFRWSVLLLTPSFIDELDRFPVTDTHFSIMRIRRDYRRSSARPNTMASTVRPSSSIPPPLHLFLVDMSTLIEL